LETRCIDDDITSVFHAIVTHDPRGCDFLHPLPDHFDIRLYERGIVVVGNQDAFAARFKVRRQQGPHPGILHLVFEMLQTHLLHRLRHAVLALVKGSEAEVCKRTDAPPIPVDPPALPVEGALVGFGVFALAARTAPGW
jgi:hypothetical protein